MIKKLFCSLVVFGYVAGVMSGDDVNAMDDKNKAEDLDGGGLFSRCGLGFLPSRLAMLKVFPPEEWVELLRFIDRNVSILLVRNEVDVLSDLSLAAISLSSPKRLKSLCDFCLTPQFDDRSRQTLCGLLTLFSRLAIKLGEPDSVLLSSSLTFLAQDLSKMENYRDTDAHPINVLAMKLAKRYSELPED